MNCVECGAETDGWKKVNGRPVCSEECELDYRDGLYEIELECEMERYREEYLKD